MDLTDRLESFGPSWAFRARFSRSIPVTPEDSEAGSQGEGDECHTFTWLYDICLYVCMFLLLIFWKGFLLQMQRVYCFWITFFKQKCLLQVELVECLGTWHLLKEVTGSLLVPSCGPPLHVRGAGAVGPGGWELWSLGKYCQIVSKNTWFFIII